MKSKQVLEEQALFLLFVEIVHVKINVKGKLILTQGQIF